MSAIPNTSDLAEIAKDCLVADSYFSGLSSAITEANPGTSDTSIVVLDDGTADPTIKRHLRERGVCVVIPPLLGGDTRDRAGTQFVLDCDLVVKVQIDPHRNKDTEHGGLGVKALDVALNVMRALCARQRHNGGEFFKPAQTAFELLKFDNGVLEYGVFVTKETRA